MRAWVAHPPSLHDASIKGTEPHDRDLFAVGERLCQDVGHGIYCVRGRCFVPFVEGCEGCDELFPVHQHPSLGHCPICPYWVTGFHEGRVASKAAMSSA